MKNVLLVLALLAVIINGCNKDEIQESEKTEIDVRDQFIGKWDVTQTLTIPEFGLNDTHVKDYLIRKDNADKRRILIWDGARDITAIVDGNTFSCKYSISLWDGTNSGKEEITSQGEVQDNKISEIGTVQINMWSKSNTGTYSAVCTRK